MRDALTSACDNQKIIPLMERKQAEVRRRYWDEYFSIE